MDGVPLLDFVCRMQPKIQNWAPVASYGSETDVISPYFDKRPKKRIQ